jgi:hypothetical protein
MAYAPPPPPTPDQSDADIIRQKINVVLGLLDVPDVDWHKVTLALGRAQAASKKLDATSDGLKCRTCKAKVGHKLGCTSYTETLRQLRADQQLIRDGGIPIGFIDLMVVEGHLRPTLCRWPRQTVIR